MTEKNPKIVKPRKPYNAFEERFGERPPKGKFKNNKLGKSPGALGGETSPIIGLEKSSKEIKEIMEMIKDGKFTAGISGLPGLTAEQEKKIKNYLKSQKFKANKPGGIEKSKPTKRLNVDDLNKNAPGGIDSKINKDGRLYNKGGRVKKQVKKKTGKLALRGYGISR